MNEMKRGITITLIVLSSMIGTLYSQVAFVHVNSEEEMEGVWQQAKEKNLNVFVDIYAVWCGPCKWMDANVFSAPEAGDYLNQGFISVKMDGETPFGSVFAREHGLEAYPSLFVFNAEKQLMNMLVGAKPWEQLEPALQNTVEFFPVLQLYDSKYESKLLLPDDYVAYIKALRKMNKESQARTVASQYSEKVMKTEVFSERDIQVLAFFIEPGTDEWKLLTADINKLRSALDDDLQGFVEQTHDQSILLAVEAQDFTIAQEFIFLLPDLAEDTNLNAGEMETRSFVYFYHYSKDYDKLIDYVDNTYLATKNGDHEWLFKAASDAVFLDPSISRMSEKGIEWFKTCLELQENFNYYFYLGLSQYYAYQVDDSLASFRKAREFASSEEESETIEGVIAEVEAQQTQ